MRRRLERTPGARPECRRSSSSRILVHALALAPLTILVVDTITGRLSANPIQDLTIRTGRPALVLLVATLAVTPACSILGLRRLVAYRRTLGLYTFLYALLHFLVFMVLDYGLDPVLLQDAIVEKPFALAGLSAFVILLSLAVTSTAAWQRRLGRKWKHLHRLIYIAAVLVIVHYTWAVKADVRPPLAWGAVVLGLLALRTTRRRTLRQRVLAALGQRPRPIRTGAARGP